SLRVAFDGVSLSLTVPARAALFLPRAKTFVFLPALRESEPESFPAAFTPTVTVTVPSLPCLTLTFFSVALKDDGGGEGGCARVTDRDAVAVFPSASVAVAVIVLAPMASGTVAVHVPSPATVAATPLALTAGGSLSF